MKSLTKFFEDKKAQLFALEMKELAIGFAVGSVVTVIVLAILIRNGTIPLSLLQNLVPEVAK